MAEKDQELLTRLRESDRDAFRDLFKGNWFIMKLAKFYNIPFVFK